MSKATAEFSRRRFLGAGLVASGLTRREFALLEALDGCSAGKVSDIEHVILITQENRSFDQYFGRYKGVRGFDDRSLGAAIFEQRYPAQATPTGFDNPLRPWHFNTAFNATSHQGECTDDVYHQWSGQHDNWNHGANDRWMASHLATDDLASRAAITMGYYDRQDLPFYYGLADAFTICDNYFSSVIGGTGINRLLAMTGSIDPDGWDGGCQFLNSSALSSLVGEVGRAGRFIPYPEVLQKAGVSWRVYGTAESQVTNNALHYFGKFRPVTGDPELSQRAFSSTTFPDDFIRDCQNGSLPAVSWLLPSVSDSDHPPYPVTWSQDRIQQVLAALVQSNLWPKSVVLLTWDENGGFFDHVSPPTPPPGTPGEYLDQAALSQQARAQATTPGGRDLSSEPIGLGFRVPMLVISPFSRNPDPNGGPIVCSDVFDHTSMLRFLETWTTARGQPARIPDRDAAARRPGLSAWRRGIVGDLTSTLGFASAPDVTTPPGLLTMKLSRVNTRILSQCVATGATGVNALKAIGVNADVPPTPNIPSQEPLPGPVRRPAACTAQPVVTPTKSTPGGSSIVPAVGLGVAGASGAALLGLSVKWWRSRRRGAAPPEPPPPPAPGQTWT